MNVVIIGSGFGIYGYLPSLIDCAEKIYLNKRYKKKIIKKIKDKLLTRIKIRKIIWYTDINLIIKKINFIVIAQNPSNQHSLILKLTNKIKTKNLFLEKPLSNNPNNALKLIKVLHKRKINFSIAFIFKYLKWYKFIYNNLSSKNKFTLLWKIKINKQNNSWKYSISEGGGLLRFYGIHFIRLLFDLNFTKLINKKIKKNQLHLNFLDKKENNILIKILFSKQNKFIMNFNGKKVFTGPNPFLKPINKNNEPRINIIKNYIKEKLIDYHTDFNNEKKFILFWKKIERDK